MKKVLLALFAVVLFLTACEPKEVLPSGVQFDKQAIALVEGDSYTLKALVNPTDAVNKELTWSSSADAVATVDQNGKVTAVKEGKATITATCKAHDTCMGQFMQNNVHDIPENQDHKPHGIRPQTSGHIKQRTNGPEE